MNNKKNNRKGFTIVELVIVIAVIAILATVLVPTFGSIIKDAKISAAKQEAKAIYTNYVAATAKTGEYVEDCYIVVGEYYIEIVKGGVVEGDPKTVPPTGKCYTLLSESSGTYTTTSSHLENCPHKAN